LRAPFVILIASSLLVLAAHACTFPVGYFFQVTALRGQVVGADSRAWWFNTHLSARSRAKLSLYEYRWPDAWNGSDRSPVAAVEADEGGKFDFGLLKVGHYSLRIDDVDWFDVEVNAEAPATDFVTINVSPVKPNCKGGHEFIVRMK
jgi:hypothetical protein